MNNNVQIIEKKTNYLAIAGFVCSLVTSGLLAFILSFIGLKKAEDCHSGHGLAIAGIIISALKITVYFILALIFTPRYVATPIKNSRCSDAYNCSCAYMSCECTYEDGFGTRETTCDRKDIKDFQIKTTKSTTTYSYGGSTYNTYY